MGLAPRIGTISLERSHEGISSILTSSGDPTTLPLERSLPVLLGYIKQTDPTIDTVAYCPLNCKGSILAVYLLGSIHNEIRCFKNKSTVCKPHRHSLSHNYVIRNCEAWQCNKWQFENTATELLSAVLFQLISPISVPTKAE